MKVDEPTLRRLVEESMDDGLRAAVAMIRIASSTKPEMTLDELARHIEACISQPVAEDEPQ